MARNLVEAGNDVIVFDVSRDAAQALLDAGARWAPTVSELATESSVVFTSLPGPPEFEAVVLGSDGVVASMRAGLVLFDLSTNSAALIRKAHAEFEKRGGALLDAPVSGGPAGAETGELAIWVGGDRELYDRHFEQLMAIGNQPRHVGAIGAGTVTKLCHNMLAANIMLCLAEAFSLAVKAGMDPLDLWEALRLGLVGRRTPLDMLTKQFLPGVYEPPAFALRGAHKDVALATSLAKELGVPMRLANLTLEEMTEAITAGFGEQDSRSFLKLQLQRAGVEIAVDAERLQRALDELAS
jgi:3-hydroxyisobutyrate dehydrogenase